MPQLTDVVRNQIIGQLQAGRSALNVARSFNISKKNVLRTRQRYQQTGSTKNRPKSGRPAKTTAKEDRRIVLTHFRNRFKTAEITKREFNALPNVNRVSVHTIRRRLRAAGLKSRKPAEKIKISPANIVRRLQWANQQIRHPLRHWHSFLFTDESRFELHSVDSRQRVYRRKNERFVASCIQTKTRGPSVMVWGGIT